jgi:hypothetical protein
MAWRAGRTNILRARCRFAVYHIITACCVCDGADLVDVAYRISLADLIDRRTCLLGKQSRFGTAAFGPAFIAASTTTAITATATFTDALAFTIPHSASGSQILDRCIDFHYRWACFRGLGARWAIFSPSLATAI